MINRLHEIILTFFYIGYLKPMPGTYASLVTAALCYYIPNNYIFYILFLILIIASYSCYLFDKKSDQKDPSYIVIDEVLGMVLALILLPKNLYLYFIAFLLFRVFDITKPSLIYHSQNLNYGIGILMDDLISGLLVLIIMVGFI